MPERPSLGQRDVHVWRVDLNQPLPIIERCRQLLSVDEQDRADRFHFESDRQHFIVGRGCLREMLARYLDIGVGAESIRLSYASHGKPELAASYSQPLPLKFNLAHSGDLALYAFTRVREIGVDLEQLRPDFTGDDIARRFFSSNEVGRLTSLPASVRHEAFFNCWTRKEAFIKALGDGVYHRLDGFDVSLAPGEPARILRVENTPGEECGWRLESFSPAAGFVAAVVTEQS